MCSEVESATMSGYSAFESLSDMPYAVSDYNIAIDNTTGYVYIAGGCDTAQTCAGPLTGFSCVCSELTNKALKYDIPNDAWSTLADMPGALYRHVGGLLDGKFYVIGGRDVNDNLVTSMYIYNVASNSWATSSTTWTAALSDSAAVVFGDSIYVAGGYDATYTLMGTLSKFTPASGTSITITTLSSMNTARGDVNAHLIDSIMYVIGGWDSAVCTVLKTVEAYNFSANSWSTKSSMADGRADMAIGSLDGHLFAIAGEQYDTGDSCNSKVNTPVDEVERYDITANTWYPEQNIPLSLFRFHGVSYEHETSPAIFIFGGQGTFVGTEADGGYFPIKLSTIKYIPVTTYNTYYKKSLNDGEIAGIVIGTIVAAVVVFAGIVAYIGYRNRGYFTKSDILTSEKEGSNAGVMASNNEDDDLAEINFSGSGL